MKEYCIDANTLITAWNVCYPKEVFSSLWKKLAFHRSGIILIKPIFDEIDPISPNDKKMTKQEKADKYPLRTWMIDNQFAETPIDESVESRSLELEKEDQIRSNSKGVSENDLKLIAYARLNEKTVVTEEGKQPNKPGTKYNYKIPTVCAEQGVECINFVDMLRLLQIQI